MTNSAKSCEQLFGRERNLPRRCEHGARHEETYFEIIDGLNKEKPMPGARSLHRLGGWRGAKHIDGGRCATAGRPAPHLRGCYRGVRAQASTTTLPASLASALRSRLRFGAVPAK